MNCHCCGQKVPEGSDAERVLLINQEARLSARIVELEFQRSNLPHVAFAVQLRESIDGQIGEAKRLLEAARARREELKA
jgi:hypothetical protein